MGHFEVCPLCGVSPVPHTESTSASEITAEELVDSLLKLCPGIIEECQHESVRVKEDLTTYLMDVMDELEPSDLGNSGSAFSSYIVSGYFDDDGAVPHEVVGDTIVKRRIPDGKMVKTRFVDYPNCGDFELEEIRKEGEPNSTHRRITRTGAYWQSGFGNFFLSECCYQFVKTWIVLENLPRRWDDHELLIEGELWEIFNSQKTGRDDVGCCDWFPPGGAENKLEQTKSWISTGEVIPIQTAEGGA